MADRRQSVEECRSETLSQLSHSLSEESRRSRGQWLSRHHLQSRFHRLRPRRQLLHRKFSSFYTKIVTRILTNKE